MVCAAVVVLGLLASTVAGGTDQPKSKPAPVPVALNVQVNVPPSWQAWLDEDVAEALIDRVRHVFRQRGFEGRIERVDAFDEPAGDVPLLTINLLEWRISHIGNIDCTLTANLQTPRGVRQLGIYTNTSMRWLTGPGRFGLARSFEQAAEGAIRQLADDVAESEMLPGLRSS